MCCLIQDCFYDIILKQSNYSYSTLFNNAIMLSTFKFFFFFFLTDVKIHCANELIFRKFWTF